MALNPRVQTLKELGAGGWGVFKSRKQERRSLKVKLYPEDQKAHKSKNKTKPQFPHKAPISNPIKAVKLP